MSENKKPEDFPTSTRIIGTAVIAGFVLIFLAIVIKIIRWILGF